MPRVSLIASTYRSERFLPAWLDSMARQTIWAGAELVVVANDPTPEELGLLTTFAGDHDQVRVVTVPREPLYRSWNRAIAEARAPIIAIANVDDLRTPEGLERQVEALESDPEALFAYGGFTISPDFPPTEPPAETIVAEPFEQEPFTRGMLLGPFMVWRASRDLATRFFDEQLKVGGDMDLAIRLALHGPGVRVDGSLGSYYNAGTGLSTGGAGQTQPIERTVLQLRYGVYDRLRTDLEWLPQATQYVIPRLLMPDGTWLAMTDVVPGYESWIESRRQRYFRPPRRRPSLARLVQAVR